MDRGWDGRALEQARVIVAHLEGEAPCADFVARHALSLLQAAGAGEADLMRLCGICLQSSPSDLI